MLKEQSSARDYQELE
nr:unnamed protein product [Callosobruchus analis]